MSQPPTIEAVRNRKTQKLFIIVDDTLGTRYKVINPTGEVLILPDLLFDEDPVTVSSQEYAAEFTTEQLDAYGKYQVQAAAQAEREKQMAARAPAPERRVVEAPKKRSTGTRPTAPSGPVRRGLGATWNSPRLTFYRHKIDPLHLKQSFKIIVEGVGEFELTKEEFLAQFNDVVMSPSYRAEGLYSYQKVPEKALRYRKGP